MTLKLIDYKMRGSGQFARNLLEYLEIPYEDVFLQSPIKIDVKWVFAATHMLPILKDGDFAVQGLTPVLKYICKKYNRHDLLGKTPKDAAKIQELMIRNNQMKNSMIMQVMPRKQWQSDNPEQRQQLIKLSFQQITRKLFLQQLNQMVSHNKWCFGYFTIGFRTGGYFPELISKYQALLQQFIQRFENIPQFQNYFNSDRMMKNLGMHNPKGLKWQGNPSYH